MLPELELVAAGLEENLQMMDQVLARFDADGIDRSPREGDYSARQTLAHLAGAGRGMTRLVRLMAAGEVPQLKSDYNNDYYNARQQEKRANMTAAEIRVELGEAHMALLELMATLKPDDLFKQGEHPIVGQSTVLGVLKTMQKHERDHILEMASSIEKVQGKRAV